MEGFGNFFFLLVMAGVLLIGELMQRARKRASRMPDPASMSDEEQPTNGPGETGSAEARPRRIKQHSPSRGERVPGLSRTEPPAAAARQLLAGRANLRRAVIVMTVLGKPVSERTRSAPPVPRT
jgi:hypothetical protein